MMENRFPPGWDESRVKALIAYYDSQTDDEAIAEAEAAYENVDEAMISVPRKLVPAVREFIAKHV